MKNIKKRVIILTLALALILLTGCSKELDNQEASDASESDEISEDLYTGEVENEEFSVTLKSGEIREGLYTGEVEKDIPNGKGKFSTENLEGEKWYYEGDFVDGEFEGTGEMVFEDGTKYIGQFHETAITEGGHSYDGKLVYEGEFADKNNYHIYEGEGVLYNSEGNEIYEGEFYNNKPSDLDKIKGLVKDATYKDLDSDESRLEDVVKVTGEIFTVWEYDGYVVYVVASDNLYEELYCIEYIPNDDEEIMKANDVATFYGEYLGLYTYETETGDNTVPYVVGWSISLN